LLRFLTAFFDVVDGAAELGSTRLKCPRAKLTAALDDRATSHHRFLIGHHLRLIEELERHIAARLLGRTVSGTDFGDRMGVV
jgi:hypothetical protein